MITAYLKDFNQTMTQLYPMPSLAAVLKEPLVSLEKHLFDRQNEIDQWFCEQWQNIMPPFYSSVDLRNAGFKIASIDTNIFPAGFNNLNPEFFSFAIAAVKDTIYQRNPEAKKVMLIPESHTRNDFYLQSIVTLRHIMQEAGFDTRVGSLRDDLHEPQALTLSSGCILEIEPVVVKNNQLCLSDFTPDCIILNNDLSAGIPDKLLGITQPILPTTELGWSSRLKSQHFSYYQQIANNFGESIELDPWLIAPLFDHCGDVDFSMTGEQDCLEEKSFALLQKIKHKYQEYGIEKSPFIVIKADQGTYGMAVMMISDPSELQQLNRKQRQRMSKLKGGRYVNKVIIQEGIHSIEMVNTDEIAEPVIYMFGQHVIGGFYRVNKSRGPAENLNAPGMYFVPMPSAQVSEIGDVSANRFYVYSVIARLAALAAGHELQSIQGN